jgi:PST family polysaccharide transporter
MFYPNEQYFRSDHLKVGLKSRSVKSAGVTLTSQLFASAIKFFGAIILARILVPDDFGLLSMTATFILLLQNFGENGFTEAIIQQKNISHHQVSSLFWINITIGFFLAFILVISAPLVASFYQDNRLIPIINIMSISILMSHLSTQHIALLKRNMKFTRIAAINLTATLLSYAIGITLAKQDYGYWALVARRLSVPTVIAIGSWLVCNWIPGIPKFNKQVKRLVFFGFFTYGNFLMNYLRRNIDKILIGRILGSEPLGYYDRAYHISNQIPQQMTVPISGVLISTLSRLREEPIRYKRYVQTLISTLGFLCMPASMLLTVIGKDLIVLLLGSHWQEAGKIVSALGPGIGMLVIYNTHGWIHLSLGNAKRLFSWGIFSLVVSIILFILGIQFGTIGVGIAYSSTFFILTLPALWYAGKPIGLSFSFFTKCLWRPFISAFLTGLITYQLLYSWTLTSIFFVELPIFARIFTLTLICAFLYIAFTIIFFWGFRPFSDFLSILAEISPNYFNHFKKNSRGINGN